MEIKLYIILCCVMLTGCVGPIIEEQFEEISIDFQRLFQIGYKLADPNDIQTNTEGIEMLIGPKNTEAFLRWYQATLAGTTAAYSLQQGVSTRSLSVREIIYEYEKVLPE